MIASLPRLVASLAILLAASGAGAAREVVLLTNEFGVLRDFADITILGDDKAARVFVDTDRFVVKGLSAIENSELQQIALKELGAKLQLVKSKEDASYLIQIRMERGPNSAIRNPQRNFSLGFVMISICHFPIQQTKSDCENLQYDYFRDDKATSIFTTVLGMWLKQTIRTPD